MKPVQPNNEDRFEQLRKVLLPILAEAAIGRFDQDVPLQKAEQRELNEILMGVQVLIEVVRQQQGDIAELEEKVHETQDRTTEILARVLDRHRQPHK
jgi:hypothetical protein